MLIELRIQDYAVIDDQSLRLGPGFNVLTGETGVGPGTRSGIGGDVLEEMLALARF